MRFRSKNDTSKNMVDRTIAGTFIASIRK